MADKKISALTGATTPLAGTEVLPIVQSGSTVKVSVANLTDGRAVTATSLAATDFVNATNSVKAGSGSNEIILQPKSILFYNTGTSDAFIKSADDTSTFNSIALNKTTVRFLTSNTERMVIDTNGNIGVSRLSPVARLDVNGQSVFQGSTLPAYRGANIGAVNINNNSADGVVDFTQGLVFTSNSNDLGAWAHAGIVTTGSAGFNGNLIFGTDGGGTSASTITERMRISAAGDVTVSTGNLVIGTANKGIDFSANANAPGMTSELLNWYEEGNWTPTFYGWTGTYATQIGKYTRIGRQVFLEAIIVTNGGTGTFSQTFPNVQGVPIAIQYLGAGAAYGQWFGVSGFSVGATNTSSGTFDYGSASEFFCNITGINTAGVGNLTNTMLSNSSNVAMRIIATYIA